MEVAENFLQILSAHASCPFCLPPPCRGLELRCEAGTGADIMIHGVTVRTEPLKENNKIRRD